MKDMATTKMYVENVFFKLTLHIEGVLLSCDEPKNEICPLCMEILHTTERKYFWQTDCCKQNVSYQDNNERSKMQRIAQPVDLTFLKF